MKPEIKACAECKYCKEYKIESVLYTTVRQCSHPKVTYRPNVIKGGYYEEGVRHARLEGKCGIGAKYWEAKA